jgi:hypothetical protein
VSHVNEYYCTRGSRRQRRVDRLNAVTAVRRSGRCQRALFDDDLRTKHKTAATRATTRIVEGSRRSIATRCIGVSCVPGILQQLLVPLPRVAKHEVSLTVERVVLGRYDNRSRVSDAPRCDGGLMGEPNWTGAAARCVNAAADGHRPHRALALTPPRRPVRRCCHRRSGARIVSSVAIVSVVWFTSTSRRRDQICEPYKVAFKFTVPESQKPN